MNYKYLKRIDLIKKFGLDLNMTTSSKITNENVNKIEESSHLSLDKTNEIADKDSTLSVPSTPLSKTVKSRLKTSSNQFSDQHYRSSSSSVNSSFKMSSASVDDDDDRFYDAIDAAENSSVFSPNSNTIANKTYSFDLIRNGENDDEEDEDVPCFFDTKTSRHASEISDCSVVGSLPNFRNKPSIVFDDKEALDTNGKTQISSKLYTNKEVNDENEDNDVELETEWSFWIDRLFEKTNFSPGFFKVLII